jgi:hypothetical protein
MPKELFDCCKFYELTDAQTYLATGSETRSFCSTVCKQGYVPVGVDGSKKGWKDEFFGAIGLQDLMKDDYIRLGGVNGIVSQMGMQKPPIAFSKLIYHRTANILALAKSLEDLARKQHRTLAFQLAYLWVAVSLMHMQAGLEQLELSMIFPPANTTQTY